MGQMFGYQLVLGGLIASFDQASGTHTGSNAHGDDSVLSVGSLQLTEDSGDHSSTSASEWVSEGNGSSSWVDLLVVESQLVAAPGGLGGESFVELIDIDVRGLESGLLQNEWDGVGWSNSHNLWRDTGDGVGDELSNNWKSVLLGDGSSGDQNDGGSVGGLRRVTGGGDSGLGEAWLQLGELFSGGSRSDSVILGDGNSLGVSLLVSVLGRDWDDLVIEPSALLSVKGSSVRFSGEFIKSSSLEAVFVGNVLKKVKT